MGVSDKAMFFFLILLSKASKVPYMLQPGSMNIIKLCDALFLFYFFDVLGVIDNCAKFQQIFVTTSFSMESPY